MNSLNRLETVIMLRDLYLLQRWWCQQSEVFFRGNQLQSQPVEKPITHITPDWSNCCLRVPQTAWGRCSLGYDSSYLLNISNVRSVKVGQIVNCSAMTLQELNAITFSTLNTLHIENLIWMPSVWSLLSLVYLNSPTPSIFSFSYIYSF